MANPTTPAEALLIRGATLIDGTGSEPVADGWVHLEGGRIAAVGAGAAPAVEGARTVDASGRWLLPGLIDAHTHLSAVVGLQAFGDAGTDTSPAELAMLIAQNLELAIDAGFTTCRETGGLDGGFATAVARGLVRGPRILPSGGVIVQTGGHGSQMPRWGDCWCPLRIPGLVTLQSVADGPDAVRLAARENFRRGATQLKVIVTGGVVSFTDELDDVQYTVAEIAAAVDEATSRGTYVTVHAHNTAGIRRAIEAGVTCVEHGTYLDEETAALMAERGVALVPTITVAHLMATEWESWGLFPDVVPRVAGAADRMREAVRIARAAGVAIGAGTDLLGPGQDRRGLELVLRAEIEDPMAAIVSQTSANARILGRGDQLGALLPGYAADAILLDRDPLADVGVFDDPGAVGMVVKGGVVMKQTR